MARIDAAAHDTPWWPWSRPPAAARARRRARARSEPPATDLAAPEDDAPAGCGWYASSHDLAQGLELTETQWIDADLPPHLALALRFV